jgi:hypothetical protein
MRNYFPSPPDSSACPMQASRMTKKETRFFSLGTLKGTRHPISLPAGYGMQASRMTEKETRFFGLWHPEGPRYPVACGEGVVIAASGLWNAGFQNDNNVTSFKVKTTQCLFSRPARRFCRFSPVRGLLLKPREARWAPPRSAHKPGRPGRRRHSPDRA